MSRIFYDHLIILTEVEAEIKSVAETEEERHELWHIVDEIIHHKMLEFFLDVLSEEHHHEFLDKFHQVPHDERHIHYLNERTEGDIEELIKKEIRKMESEILKEIRVD